MARSLKLHGQPLRWLALVCLLMLAGCYPHHNWREMPVADGLAVIAFPARVETAARKIELADQQLEFVLSTAKVDRTLFSFGYAQLPAASTLAQRVAVQAAMVQSLTAGLGAQPTPEALAGALFQLESPDVARPLVVAARVLLHYDVVMRVVVSGPPEELSDALIQEFMRSLVLR